MINHGKSIFPQNQFFIRGKKNQTNSLFCIFCRWSFSGKTSAPGKNFISGKIPSNQVRGHWCQTTSHYYMVGWWKTGKENEGSTLLQLLCNDLYFGCKHSIFHGVEWLEWSVYPIVTLLFIFLFLKLQFSDWDKIYR